MDFFKGLFLFSAVVGEGGTPSTVRDFKTQTAH